MRRHYKPMSQSARDASADRKRAEAEARGEPIRTDDDCRVPIELDLSCVGGERMTLRPVRGKHAWQAWSAEGRMLRRAALKSLLVWASDSLPRMQAPSVK